jgi:hypothetical protein
VVESQITAQVTVVQPTLPVVQQLITVAVVAVAVDLEMLPAVLAEMVSLSSRSTSLQQSHLIPIPLQVVHLVHRRFHKLQLARQSLLQRKERW